MPVARLSRNGGKEMKEEKEETFDPDQFVNHWLELDRQLYKEEVKWWANFYNCKGYGVELSGKETLEEVFLLVQDYQKKRN